MEWAVATHQVAQLVWNARPTDNILNDVYFQMVLPLQDQQLGLAGIRLAAFLNEAFAPNACRTH